MKPGNLRNNRVPFSARGRLRRAYGSRLVAASIVENPKYLYVPWVVSNHFRREAEGYKWDPQPCELILPSKLRANRGATHEIRPMLVRYHEGGSGLSVRIL